MRCGVCGGELPEGALFCGECGSSVGAKRAKTPTTRIIAEPGRSVGAGEPAPPTHPAGPVLPEASLEASFELAFSTGEVIAVSAGGLLGRRPVPEPGELVDRLVSIVDPGRSVSKTHLEFGVSAGGLWISDRYSGNGTVIRHLDGQTRICEPGRRYRVERGARVEIGEQSFTIG